MSGRELDPDGTDSYHPQHPWESAGHPQYLAPRDRTRFNWPPEPARPAGTHEARVWASLPARIAVPPIARTFGPGHTYGESESTRAPLLCLLGIHRHPHYVDAHTQAPAPIRCERCGKPRTR